MSKINDLIQSLCPNGVIYKTVGAICRISRGIVMSKDFIRDNAGDYPVYSSQTENNGELGRINTFMFNGEYLTWTTDGANAGSVFYRNGKFSVTNVCGLLQIVDKTVNVRFLYYALQSAAKPYVNRGMGNAKLMSNVMATVPVPVPPIEVQLEIVRILDAFSDLSSYLADELSCRIIQYSIYKDVLLEPKEGWNKYCLDDLCELITKQTGFDYAETIKPSLVQTASADTYSFIQNKDFSGLHINFDTDYYVPKTIAHKFPKILLDKPCILVSISGKIGNVGLFDCDKTAFIGGAIGICRLKTFFNPKFVLFFMQSKFGQSQLVKSVKAASHLNITIEDLRKMVIYLPDLKTQNEIVDTLLSFETYCNSEKYGLPAEIKIRQKQYEYYKEKLFSFKELKQ